MAASTSPLPKIGIVGAGRMGANIARRLHDVGYPVAALYDVNRDSAAAVAKETGGEVVDSLARVTSLSDVVLTVVTDDAAVYRIFAENGDSLLEKARGKVFINCATISPKVHEDVERLANARGAESLEACMASSIPQARNGTLYLMIGGKRDVFERVKPLLEKMSASLKYIGKAGRAAQVKALVNMVMNINTAGLAEGLGLGDALGLDLDMLREVFSQTGANSRVLETDGADMQNRDHDVYFSAAHAAKDSGIALELAREAHLSLPLATATFEQYEKMKSLGLGELDKSGVSELTFASRHAQRAATSL
ncbi:MAG: NAD(P)-dependent oxidoreductase [Candidatus Eremiobacteraeota bacterium]|nr:NAD(P)-dependent oxidoreductase [Candidatus Eremiobacteraeota bacterium]MBV9057290.1 NAD(P)-dependent oxidoreductase [Candidatus Eremiobacteraeota bacterium]